jgi:hypothetical protein
MNALTSCVIIDHLQKPLLLEGVQSFANEICQSMRSLADLTALQTKMFNDLTPSTSFMASLAQLSCAVEHRLLKTRLPSTLGVDTNIKFLLYEGCRLTQLICVSYILRNLRTSSTTMKHLVNRLTKTLTLLAPLFYAITDSTEKEMLLWIVCVGGIASKDQEGCARMVANLVWNQQDAAIQSVQTSISKFVWNFRMQDKSYETFMEKVRCQLGNKEVALSVHSSI